MRFAFLILVFVSSVWSTTEPAEARRGDPVVQARKPQKAQKRRAVAKVAKAAKPARARPGKKSGKQAPKVVEEVADDTPEPPVVAKAEPVRRAPVAQAIDDEVPRNEPRRGKR